MEGDDICCVVLLQDGIPWTSLPSLRLPRTATIAQWKEAIRKQGADLALDIPVDSQRLFLDPHGQNVYAEDDTTAIESFTALLRRRVFKDPTSEHELWAYLFYEQVPVVVYTQATTLENNRREWQSHQFRMHRCAFVEELHDRIEERLCVPKNKQMLYWKTRLLKPEKREYSYVQDSGYFSFKKTTLKDYVKDREERVFSLMPFKATINTMPGARIQIGYQTVSDTFQDLRRRLAEEGFDIDENGAPVKIPLEEQQLFLRGTRLANDDNMPMEELQQKSQLSEGAPLVLHLVQSRQTHGFEMCLDYKEKFCRIHKAEYRAITLQQLHALACEVTVRCCREAWKSTNTGKPLQPEDVTLYDLVHYVVYPSTTKHKCSYVELVASEPQKPRWLASHWWGGTFFHLVSCLTRHALDRDMKIDDPTACYWICAFAMNQHNLEEELNTSEPQDPKSYLQNSPFYRAIQLAEGTVSILDTQATCYSRIWCAFEISIATDRENHLYDIYTVTGGPNSRGVGLADATEHRDWWSLQKQLRRQQDFPLAICQSGLHVRLESAEASVAEDKSRILQYLCMRGQSGGSSVWSTSASDPPSTHPAFDMVNARLHCKFAISTYRYALDQGIDLECYRSALSNNRELRSLSMSFAGCQPFKQEALHFVASLPSQLLQKLELDYSEIGFETADQFALGLGDLSALKTFILVIRSKKGSKYKCSRCLFQELARICSLMELDLDLEGCDNQHTIDDLALLSNLSSLRLRLTHPSNLHSISRMASLETLHLQLEALDTLETIDSLGRAMTGLIAMHLQLKYCNDLHSLQGLASLSTLKMLRLDFKLDLCGSKIKTLHGLEQLPSNLHHFGLSLKDEWYYNRPLAMDDLASALGSQPDLQSLYLDFRECNLPSLEPLGELLSRPSSKVADLTVLILSCSGKGASFKRVQSFWRRVARNSSNIQQLKLWFLDNLGTSFSAQTVETLRNQLRKWASQEVKEALSKKIPLVSWDRIIR